MSNENQLYCGPWIMVRNIRSRETKLFPSMLLIQLEQGKDYSWGVLFPHPVIIFLSNTSFFNHTLVMGKEKAFLPTLHGMSRFTQHSFSQSTLFRSVSFKFENQLKLSLKAERGKDYLKVQLRWYNFNVWYYDDLWIEDMGREGGKIKLHWMFPLCHVNVANSHILPYLITYLWVQQIYLPIIF